MPVRGLRKRSNVQNLAAERRQKPKERTRGYCGSRKTVTVTGRWMTRRPGVAWLRRSVVIQDCSRAKVDEQHKE
jgi:hypothetical protein